MKKKRIYIFVFVVLVVGFIIYLLVNGFGKPKLASIEVDSNSKLHVFIDGKDVGEAPYTGIYEPKVVTVKIGDFETRVKLVTQVKTIIRRGDGDGEVVSFEKIVGSDAVLAVVTDPNVAQVKVDNEVRGETPVNVTLTSGTHQLEVSANGYNLVKLPVNLVGGYKLTAVVDLSPIVVKPTPKPEETPNELNQAMVEILATPNGFLRVRSDPNIASSEIAQVHEGEKYRLIKTDTKSGWYDIQLTASVSGWVSNVYATLK